MLLRRGLDPASTPNERNIAFREALREVTVLRTVDRAEWVKTPVMRFRKCVLCLGSILPLKPAYKRRDEYAHAECVED